MLATYIRFVESFVENDAVLRAKKPGIIHASVRSDSRICIVVTRTKNLTVLLIIFDLQVSPHTTTTIFVPTISKLLHDHAHVLLLVYGNSRQTSPPEDHQRTRFPLPTVGRQRMAQVSDSRAIVVYLQYGDLRVGLHSVVGEEARVRVF